MDDYGDETELEIIIDAGTREAMDFDARWLNPPHKIDPNHWSAAFFEGFTSIAETGCAFTITDCPPGSGEVIGATWTQFISGPRLHE